MNMTFLMARTHPSHDYLNPAVAAFLRESSPPGRMLDFGCGNGSLITHSAIMASNSMASMGTLYSSKGRAPAPDPRNPKPGIRQAVIWSRAHADTLQVSPWLHDKAESI